MKPKLREDINFVVEFSQKPKQFRIEAVIHDGEYYTKEKWAKISKTEIDDIEHFIKNTDYLIQKQDSYRVNLKEIYRWYDLNNLKVDEPVVPNNFTPKIFGGQLESDVLDILDRRYLGNLMISNIEESTLRELIKGYGRIIYHDTQYVVHSYSSKYLKEVVLKKSKAKITHRESIKLRELSDFNEAFLAEFFEFYLKFSISKLKRHLSILNMFFDNTDDKISMTYEWIIKALCKFDNTKGVPFSGYLSFVLDKYPYDLSVAILGKDLTEFRRKVVKLSDNLTLEQKLESMGLTQKQFQELEQRNIAFETTKPLDVEFDWDLIEDTSEVHLENAKFINYDISLIILESILETHKYDEFNNIIKLINKEDVKVDSTLKELILEKIQNLDN